MVVAIGMHSEIGRIATLLQQEERGETPLQQLLAQFGKRLSVIISVICGLVFIGGLVRGESPLIIFMTAVSLAVAATPEALPAVVTISLALGAAKLVKSQSLVRKLPSIETLGSVTHICSDKTGTLTQNKMDVEVIDSVQGDEAGSLSADDDSKLIAGIALCNDSTIGSDGQFLGDPTETALYRAAFERGVDPELYATSHPRLAELPFDSMRKRMTTFHRWNEGVVSFTKGAPEQIFTILAHNSPDSHRQQDSLKQRNNELATSGLRVLAFGYRFWKKLPEIISVATVETELQFSGLVGMLDPPRPEAAAAVADCQRAGIIPIMITGDHPLTAESIALRLGIIKERAPALIGQKLAMLSDGELEQVVNKERVYARISPEEKLRIVTALQRQGHYVAMTGDGVNDVPALKRADIGVTMGITGTAVAKEAAFIAVEVEKMLRRRYS